MERWRVTACVKFVVMPGIGVKTQHFTRKLGLIKKTAREGEMHQIET